MKFSRISALVLTGAVAVAMTACGEPQDSTQAPADDKKSGADSTGKDDKEAKDSDDTGVSTDDVTVTLSKSGGIAGTMETLEVAADGSWSYAKNKMAPEKGELSGKEHDELLTLVSGKSIADVDNPKSDQQCNDIPTYSLTVEPAKGEPVKVKTDQCGGKPNDEFGEVVELLTEATPI